MLPIENIQNWLKINNIEIFIINRTDEFLGEYIALYAERLKWISNFSGSAGRAIIEKDKAYIFIDGRYTKQVKEEVDRNFFIIKHLKDYWSHLENYKNKIKNISLDPNLHSISEVKKIKKIFNKKITSIKILKKNPIDLFWTDQPQSPNSRAFLHPLKFTGKNSLIKINKIQKKLKINNTKYYLLTSLDSIAWILNIRGNDISYTPLLCCYLVIPNKGKVRLFIKKEKISQKIIKKLIKFVDILEFKKLKKYIQSVLVNNNFGMDYNLTPYYFEDICLKNKIITKNIANPCIDFKAKKNPTELQGARNANLRDGVSVTKFIFWLKNIINTYDMSEIKASDYLYKLRSNNELFYSLSFETISAFSYHAALPHYRVTEKTNLKFKKNKMYLFDSGAQYLDGTTDITRTIIVGKPSAEEKDRFTRVLKGHIALAKAVFPKNSKGSDLDSLARNSLKDVKCDYDHGTGHGIGSFLSVHEGPQRISKINYKNEPIMQKGMIISNEPGYYKDDEYGIRIENLLICSSFNNELLCFETISFAPIDIDLIKLSIMTKGEISWLNNYHKKVYSKLSFYLTIKEKLWLKNVTRPLVLNKDIKNKI